MTETTFRPNLMDFSLTELTGLSVSLGEKPYRGHQLGVWLFRHGVRDLNQMTDISKKFRKKLAATTRLYHPRVLEVAQDSEVRKILWGLEDGNTVESVLIRERDHLTLCLSCQVGCPLGCRFCRTATLGFTRNLSSGEILGQILGARELISQGENLTNLVFMGMGEPLLNLENVLKSLAIITDSDFMAVARKHISLSTVGIVPALPLLAQGPEIGLTISLTAANDELRNQLMPVNQRYGLAELKKAMAAWPLPRGRRITIAYVLLPQINDRPEQALELSRYLAGLKVKINLIPFNPWPGAPFAAPRPDPVEQFKNVLVGKQHTVMIRWSKGTAVAAACGQLAGERRGEVPHKNEDPPLS